MYSYTYLYLSSDNRVNTIWHGQAVQTEFCIVVAIVFALTFGSAVSAT